MFAREGAGLVWGMVLVTCGLTSCDLLQNGDFEQGMDPWNCWNIHCELLHHPTSHQGSASLRVYGRTHDYEGPSQLITTVPGRDYQASSWIRLLNDEDGKLGQRVELEVNFLFPDNTHSYINVAMKPLVRSSDGWFFLKGDFQAPTKPVNSTTFYYQGPAPGIEYAIDLATVEEVRPDTNWRASTDAGIDQFRKNDIFVNVSTTGSIDKSAVKIQILQTKKAFPFGSTVHSWNYVDPSKQAYRDFIHTHFNWAVPGNILKWRQFDWNSQSEGPTDVLYQRAADTLSGLQKAGLKIRGHNMVWSVEQFIPDHIKVLSGGALRQRVKHHINWVMNATRGMLEHWDVNNENLHGQWFQERLADRDYDLELFKEMHAADPVPRLFLNEYNVVAQGAATSAYLSQGMRFINARVSMHGMGVQSHFGSEQDPNPTQMRKHLDTLGGLRVPLWATELDVSFVNETKRADAIEKALRVLYAHGAVEGIMFWSWHSDNASDPQALVYGDSMQLTAAGRRMLDLLENQWMTDETHVLSVAGDSFTVRGFHGDYEVRVMYHGQEMMALRKTFTLHKSDRELHVSVHN